MDADSCFALSVTPIYLNARRGRDAQLPWLLALQVHVAHCAGRFIAGLAAGSKSGVAEIASNVWLAAPLFEVSFFFNRSEAMLCEILLTIYIFSAISQGAHANRRDGA